MGKHRRAWLTLLSVALATGLIWFILHEPREPSYQGKPLIVWLDDVQRHPDESSQAIRAMGVKSIPFLLDMLEAREIPLKLKFLEWARLQSRLEHSLETFNTLHARAYVGFQTLGPMAKPAIPQLAKFLANSPEPILEADALRLIGPEAIGALTNALASPKTRVRVVAAVALGRYAFDETQGKDLADAKTMAEFQSIAAQIVPALIARARDPDADVRNNAYQSLYFFFKAPGPAVPLLIPLVGDKDRNVRWFATAAFAAFAPGAKSAVPALLKALHDPDREIRQNSTLALAYINPNDPAIAAALTQNLHDTDPLVRSYTIMALGLAGPPARSFVPDLVKALQDEKEFVRSGAVIALGKIDPQNPDVLALLLNCLRDDRSIFRNRAASELGEIGTPAKVAIPELVNLINDDTDAEVRMSAISALIQIAPENPAGVSRLVRDLQAPDLVSRGFALEALGLLQHKPVAKTAIPELLNLVQTGTGDVSSAAAFALAMIDPENPASVDPIVKALQNSDPVMRQFAAKSLGSIGKPAQSAVPQLLKALKDSDAEVRAAARSSLKSIDPTAAASAGIK